jgi:dimethylamine/trimethylamine dehydrogenase
MAKKYPKGDVIVFDDDYYYMANALAEALVQSGCTVTYIITSPEVAPFTYATLEQHRVQARLLDLGIKVITGHSISEIGVDGIRTVCSYSGKDTFLHCDAVLPITSRLQNDSLVHELLAYENLQESGIKSVNAIGDCESPGSIATAVYSGHLYARQLDNPKDQRYEFLRENYQPSE